MSLAELWRQVAEAPDDLAPRLVLADALLERGDPRGELLGLQLRGADSSIVIDDEVGPVGERVSEMIAMYWDTWLGPAAQLIRRPGSQFRDGMLSLIEVGTDDAVADELWDACGAHHELGAVRHVRRGKCHPREYGRFLASLVHTPRHVELPIGAIAMIHARRRHWPVTTLRQQHSFWDGRDFHVEVTKLAEIAPTLERLELDSRWIPEEQQEAALAAIADLPRRFPNLRSVVIEEARRTWFRDLDEAQITAVVTAMPILELRS